MTTPMPNPGFIYKICTAETFAAAGSAGIFTGMPIDDRDGYIHFSTASQLADTLRLHFAGQGVVVFGVRSADVAANLRWEPSRGGQLFPHLYGGFPVSIIAWHALVEVNQDGSVNLPAEVV